MGGWHLRNLRLKSLEIYCQINIYGWILGGTIKFEFEFSYKLRVPIHQRTLCIVRIFALCFPLFMNPQVFADLVASSVFDRLPKDTQQFILNTMSGPGKTKITGGTISSEGASPEVVSIEAPTTMPTAPRSPRPKPTLVREAPKPKKDKEKRPMLLHESKRKHSATQAQKKEKQPMKDKGKVVDSEVKECVEDIDVEGMERCKIISLCVREK